MVQRLFVCVAAVGWTACSGEAPTPFMVNGSTKQAAPHSDPAPPPAPRQPATIDLAPPVEEAGIGTKGCSHDDLAVYEDQLIDHPSPQGIPYFLAVEFGEKWLALGMQESEGAWTLSADLDGDGALSPTERVTLVPDSSGEPRGELHGQIVRGETSVRTTIRVTARKTDGVQVFDVESRASRSGVLPNGVAFTVYNHGGIYDHPQSELVVDENGDGKADGGNWLVSFRVADEIVEARGDRWRFTVAADGSTVSLEPTDEAPPGKRVGGPAPTFSVVASDGNTHDLLRYRGKKLLLDFWATWCAPCIALHPEVEALAAKHELAVLGISADDDQTALNRWLKQHPTSWPSAAVGPAGAVNQAYGVDSWPSHALIDGEGKLVSLGSFAAVKDALESTE